MIRPSGQVAILSSGVVQGPSAQPWAHREGDTVEAMVIEVVGGDRARLGLLGVVLEARTPFPLRPGTVLSVRLGPKIGGVPQLEVSPGHLLLDAKGSAGEIAGDGRQRNSTVGRLQAIAALMNLELGRSDAAGLMSDGEKEQAASPPASLSEAESIADHAFVSVQATSRHPVAPSAEGHGAGELAAENARPGAAFQSTLPVQVHGPSGAVQMLELRADWEDEPDSPPGRSEARGGSWVVRCTLDSPSHGMVHAAIEHGPVGVSVRLWAEQQEAALALLSCRPEMEHALLETAIQVERLDILTGLPSPLMAAKMSGHEREEPT